MNDAFARRASSATRRGDIPARLGTFARIAIRDALGRRQRLHDARTHLDAAIVWLKLAHDMGCVGASREAGVSYGYDVRGGWRPSYRETSGYIAVTFFRVAERSRDADARMRAIGICRWLCGVQNADGSIANPRYGPDGIVFDTGQVLQAFVVAFAETADGRFLDAAHRAAGWLVAVADGDRRWTRNTFRGVPHVYNTRTAWPLLALDAIDPRPEYRRVALANLDWALEQQVASGWFDHCAFSPGVAPFTHTLAYALEGLLEAGLLLDDARYVDAARRGAEAALRDVRADGFVPGRIDVSGKARAVYACLVGSCQLALVWGKLHVQSKDERFRLAAVRALHYVMGCQELDTADTDARGAIKGSQPVWAAYAPFTFPSWAAKFFVDATMQCAGWL